MSARRTSTSSVSLFPFLAVLVCAMGALILLLLVTTRRVRQEKLREAETAVPTDEPAAYTVPTITNETAPPPVPVVVPAPREEFADEPIPPLMAAEPPSVSEPDMVVDRAAELRAEWEHIVAELRREDADLRAALASLADDVAGHAARAAEVEQQRTAIETRLRAVRAEAAEAEAALQALARRRDHAARDVVDLQSRLEQVRAARAEAEGRFEILPYDGRTGTTRRPILIECTAEGFHFTAEDVLLTPEQVNGFIPAHNPLLAGSRALMEFWSRRDRERRHSAADRGEPYVLLIVRPGGTVAFYVARRLLEALDEPFGYELLTDAQEFVAPESDPAAKAALEAAIDALLSRQERLLARTRSGRLPVAEPLRFADEDGGFYLQEVERLRENTRSVYFGGREFGRGEAGAAAAGRSGTESRRNARSRSEAAPGHGRTREFDGAGPSRRLTTGDPLYDSQIAPQPGTRTHGRPTHRSGPAGDAGTGTEVRHGGDGTSAGGRADESPTATGPRHSPASSGPGRTAAGGLADGTSSAGSNAASSSNLIPVPLRGPQGEPPLDLENPRWGLRDAGSSIGLEREVTVRIDAREVRVADEPPLRIASGVSRDDLQRELARVLDAHVRSWGRPPQSFFWTPAIRFEVAPGGHQYHQRLAELVEAWRLRTTVEYVLD